VMIHEEESSRHVSLLDRRIYSPPACKSLPQRKLSHP
jgi:hypothetical protein